MKKRLNLKKIKEKSNNLDIGQGYCFEVDVQYPKCLHKIHKF